MEIDFKEKDNSICSFLNDWINKCNNSGNIKETCSWKFKDLDQNNPIVQANYHLRLFKKMMVIYFLMLRLSQQKE